MKAPETIEATLAAMGQKATLAGVSTTGAAWWMSNEALGLFGLLIGIAGLIVNFYYRRKDDKRAQALFEAQMRKIEGGAHE